MTNARASLYAIVACGMLAVATPASAQDCNAVLSSNAYDVYNSATISAFQQATLFDLCKTRWSSVDEYNSKARSLGSGGQYYAISGFLNLDSKDEKKSLNEIYEHICVKSSENVQSYLFSSSHTQIAKYAVGAWDRCVERTADGLYSTIKRADETDRFVIEVHFKSQTGGALT
jgi:hypothetical protein